MKNRNVEFDQFDPTVLEHFGINSKKQIDALLEQFSVGFAREGGA